MKLKITLQFALGMCLLFGVLSSISSCKDDDAVDPKAEKINQLTASWNIESVANDDNDVAGQFTGMTLTIDGTNYTTQNGGNPWPSSGTYTFKDNDLNTIIRSDGVEILLVEVTATTLILSFNYSSVNGRVEGITGSFTFSMIKQ